MKTNYHYLTPVSQKTHRKNRDKCPYCRSTNIVVDRLEMSGLGAIQPVTCHECGKKWDDNFKFDGFDPHT